MSHNPSALMDQNSLGRTTEWMLPRDLDLPRLHGTQKDILVTSSFDLSSGIVPYHSRAA